MAGRNLGEAFVSILPDAGLFRAQLLAKLKTALAGVTASIPVSLDDRKALAQLAAMRAAIAQGLSIKVGIDQGSAIAAALQLRQIMSRAGLADFLDVNMPVGKIASQLQLLRRMVNQAGLSDLLGFNIDRSKLAAQIALIGNMSESIPVNFDVGKLSQIAIPGATEMLHLAIDAGDIAAVTAELDALTRPRVIEITEIINQAMGTTSGTEMLHLAIDAGDIAAVTAELDALTRPRVLEITAGADFNVVDAEIVDAIAETDILQKSLADLKAEADFTILDAEIVSESKVLDAFTRPRVIEITEIIEAIGGGSTGASMNFTEMLHGATEATGALGELETAKDKLSGDITGTLNPAVRQAGNYINVWGVNLATLTGHVGLLHVVIDGFIEAVIAVGLAAAAAAIGMAAMASTAIDIYNHITAVNEVNSALGDQIPVLGGDFRDFAESVQNASQVLEIYGGLINGISGQTGAFVSIGHEVVTMVDDWVAEFDIWEKSQNGVGQLLQSGTDFLGQFASIIGKVLLAIDNLVTADPGVAHFLLDFISGLASLLDWVTKLPAPLLEFALAIHGAYIWGNVLVGVLGNIIPGLSKLTGAIIGLGTGPLLILAALGIAAYNLAAQWGNASPKIAKSIADINAALASMSASSALTAIPMFIATLNSELAQLNTGGASQVNQVLQGWQGWGSAIQETNDKLKAFGTDLSGTVSGSLLHQVDSLGNAFKLVFDPGYAAGAAAVVQVQNNIADVNAEITKLEGSYANLDTATGDLVRGNDSFNVATHSVTQALALMNLAGVQSTDTVALMLQKVQNLVTGYQAMSVQGNLLAGAVDAITLSAEVQGSKITQLTQSYSAWFALITGGISTFTTFAQQVGGLYQSLTTAGLKLTDSNGKVNSSLTLLATGGSNAAASMTGLNSASLTAQQTFVQTASAAQNQFNSLVTLTSAAGLGAKGTTMLTQAMNDYMLLLIPATQGNSAMQQSLVSMYQEVNPNVTSFGQLKKAVGDNQSPLEDLDKITTTLTKDAGNLTQDVQNLATALHQDLNAAMAEVVLTESGGIKPMEDLYTAIKTTGLNSQDTAKQALALGQQFLTLTGNTSDAQSEFITFAEKGLNLTQAAATALWNEIKGQLQPVVAGTGETAVTAANQIDTNFVTSLQKIGFTIPGVQTAVKNFTAAVQATGDTSTATAGARAKLIADLESAGIQANVAKSLVNGLQTQINNMKGKTVTVGVNATGSGGVTIAGQNISGAQVASILVRGMAGGGIVPGGFGGGDVMPALLEPGEAVVDKQTTRKFARVLKAMGVPGFAAGGIVDLPGAMQAPTGYDTGLAMRTDTVLAINALKAKAAAQLAAQAAAMSGGISSAGVSNASAEMALASAAYKMGWGGSQWAALYDVEMREAGFNLTATNPTSGAYGMAQFINGSAEYAQYGGNSTTAAGQATAMVNYIAQRYGNPQAAWNHELAYGWYDSGGWLPPGKSIAINNTGQPERVTPGGGGTMTPGEQALCDRLDALISVTGQQGGKFAGALNSLSASAAQRGSYSTRRG